MQEAAVAAQLVKHCGDKDRAIQTAECLVSKHFLWSPRESQFWTRVVNVLRNEMVSQ
jgi:hypothetical protein